MESSLVRLIGKPGDAQVATRVLARAEARQLQKPSDPGMCQEQTAIARTFNDERFQEWEERMTYERKKAKVEERQQMTVAADIAQALVFADEAPLLFRLQTVMGRASRSSSSSRSRSRGENTSTSDGGQSEAAESDSATDSSQEEVECFSTTADKASSQPSAPGTVQDGSQQAMRERIRWLEECRTKLQERLKGHTEEELAATDVVTDEIIPPERTPVLI